jgi:hypothetical protein
MQRIQELINTIAIELHKVMIDSDELLEVVIAAVHDFHEYGFIAYDSDGKERPADCDADLDETFIELREAMYQVSPGKGAWYVAIISVNKEGEVTSKFDYDDRSRFTLIPSEEEFAADLRKYPRDQL